MAAPNDDVDNDHTFDLVVVGVVDVEVEKFDRAVVSMYEGRVNGGISVCEVDPRVNGDISVFELDEDIVSNHFWCSERGITCYKRHG